MPKVQDKARKNKNRFISQPMEGDAIKDHVSDTQKVFDDLKRQFKKD